MESILFNYKKGYDLLSFSFWNWGKSIILICVLFQMICKHGYLQKAFKSVRAIILIHRKQWAVRSDYSDTAAPCLHLARSQIIFVAIVHLRLNLSSLPRWQCGASQVVGFVLPVYLRSGTVALWYRTVQHITVVQYSTLLWYSSLTDWEHGPPLKITDHDFKNFFKFW